MPTLVDLPSNLLLHIAHRASPQSRDKSDNKLEKQRKTFRWPTTSRTPAKRAFYIGMRLCYRLADNLFMERNIIKHISYSLYAPTPLDLSPHPNTSDPFLFT